MIKKVILILCLLLIGCYSKQEDKHPLYVYNKTNKDTLLYVYFGSDSEIIADNLCNCSNCDHCTFSISAGRGMKIDTYGRYLQATLSFDSFGCNATKAEVAINIPQVTGELAKYDTVDISLVDGFSNNIEMDIDGVVLGPTNGFDKNENAYGVFPYGCDICTARESPPQCGIVWPKNNEGCKKGVPDNPKVACQHTAARFGVTTTISLIE